MTRLKSVVARGMQRPWLAVRLTILFWRLIGRLRREERARQAAGASMVWGHGLARQMAGLMAAHGDQEGLTRVRRYLAFLLLEGEASHITYRRAGRHWTTPVGEYVSWCLFNDGEYQEDIIRGLARWATKHGYLAKERAVVVDVGANIGSSSIPLLESTGCPVISFEPVPANFDLLQRNVIQNGLEQRVTVVNCAIAEQPGQLAMVTHPTNWGAAEVRENGAGTGATVPGATAGVVIVPARPLIDLLAERGITPDRVGVVWSDTQGYERSVIESGAPLWAAGVPLFVEIMPPALNRHGGIAAFLASVERHFERMVLDSDLIQRGADAPSRPIADLPGLIASIVGEDFRDVLLVPRRG